MLDTEDSDGDGTPNGVEAVTPHHELAGEVGYNMGLTGPLGTSPCAADPVAPVTGVSESPAEAVHSASEWGLIGLALLLLCAGAGVVQRRLPAERS